MSERKRARAEDLGGGGAPVDLSGRASKQFVGAALESIERLARASGHGALLDAAGEAAIAAELTRCLARSMVERRPAVTPVALGDVFDVAELAVRILVSLPLEDRLGCARVCRGWGQSVRLDCEDERRHESKTLRSVLLRRMDAPVVQLGLFSRFPSAPVLVRARFLREWRACSPAPPLSSCRASSSSARVAGHCASACAQHRACSP